MFTLNLNVFVEPRYHLSFQSFDKSFVFGKFSEQNVVALNRLLLCFIICRLQIYLVLYETLLLTLILHNILQIKPSLAVLYYLWVSS